MEYKVLNKKDSQYPESLRNIALPPENLYCSGDVSLLDSLCVAVVGSRKLSDYGKRTAFRLGEKLAMAGVTVVSGMARGGDTFAHKGALKAGGKTIAVMGTSIDLCYPAMNRQLKEEIASSGLVMSEFPPGYPTERKNFPMRNRIISGLSQATIIAEAGLNSGALITANIAMDQGKSVYVVPANIDNPKALGGNLLLKDGAMPLVLLDDVLDDLGIARNSVDEDSMPDLADDEKRIVSALMTKAELTVDEICVVTKLSPAEVNGIVTVLEMKGLLHTSMGKIFLAK